MANLARYGSVQPSEFEAMDEESTLALAKEIEQLRRHDEETLVELTKAVIRSNGGRLQ